MKGNISVKPERLLTESTLKYHLSQITAQDTVLN